MGLKGNGSDLLLDGLWATRAHAVLVPRVIAVEDADVQQVLENVKRRNEITYDFVDVIRATGSPCVKGETP